MAEMANNLYERVEEILQLKISTTEKKDKLEEVGVSVQNSLTLIIEIKSTGAKWECTDVQENGFGAPPSTFSAKERQIFVAVARCFLFPSFC